MRLQRRGRVLLLDPTEAAILEDVLRDARMTLRDGDTRRPEVTRRLFPDAYPDDAAASAEFRELTADRTTERADRVERCRALAEQALDTGHVDLTGPDVLTDLIQALNEVRLIMGTRIGVTASDDDDGRDRDPTDPADRAWFVYQWLTAAQDMLVTAAMG